MCLYNCVCNNACIIAMRMMCLHHNNTHDVRARNVRANVHTHMSWQTIRMMCAHAMFEPMCTHTCHGRVCIGILVAPGWYPSWAG